MKLILDTGKCTGCKICQLACSATHIGAFNPQKAHLKIIDTDKLAGTSRRLISCTMCLKCVDSCPVGAIGQDDDHLLVSVKTCIGCGQCVDACPNGIIYMNDNHTAAVPDFCQGHPVCIDWCPHDAIHKE